MAKQLIRLAHSPDPDDAFMFYGLAGGMVPSGDFEFEHILKDIQTLNNWAHEGKLEITAVSVHAYAYVHDKYALLSSGASMGAADLACYNPKNTPGADDAAKINRAQGPLLIARQPISLTEIAQKTIAVPGTTTSAFLALQLALGSFDYQVMMFDQIPHAVRQGQIDAGLIIHEGQLTYQQWGLHCVLDLGRWWFERTQLPLPLGCNIIRRDLPAPAVKQISRILKSSIEYGLAHRDEAVAYALKFGPDLNRTQADEFVGMYVNEWTIDYGPVGRQAVKEFLRQGYQAGLIPQVERLDFV
ncbi:MAG: ABC transporter substrate-binding protein [Phycisphaerae bacterium SM23_30]|nr:MAG: ABC transporter substrate-binding protein [Phycisphaerae bacterium SM23_30]